jgi:hypothetical protein
LEAKGPNSPLAWDGREAKVHFGRCLSHTLSFHPVSNLEPPEGNFNKIITLQAMGVAHSPAHGIHTSLVTTEVPVRFPCEQQSAEACESASPQCTTDPNAVWSKGNDATSYSDPQTWLPGNAEAKIVQLIEFTGCSRQKAIETLGQTQYIVESAAARLVH